MTERVLLIPGFFAFDEIGELRYFLGVREALEEAYAARGRDVRIHEVTTLPTASIRHRAAKVLDAAAALLDEGEGPLHLVGHSTGGLDARLAIAPTARLPSERVHEGVLEHVRSVVSVSTPHGGSPLASFFASAAGKPLLRLLTAMAALMLEKGAIPTGVIVKLGDVWRRLDDLAGLRETALDELYETVLSDLSEERRERIIGLLREIGDDTSLVFQLTPEGVDLLDAATGDPERTAYGCVVTRAPKPTLRTVGHLEHDVYAQWLHGLYVLLSTITARSRSDVTLQPHQRRALEEGLGEVPPDEAHDGMVPVLSQLWGDVIGAVEADHLDVVGHYGDGETRASDWLPSGSGFDREGFEDTWARVADYQIRASDAAG
ncbi:MAG TPA: hypothetical protein RMH99_28135 [Sandaracinaceae bacterium LLY-WYZ-13_1]|nr:hypothetical protein [Sandaracinaceae bacterium LLY-WYZ-13_1]